MNEESMGLTDRMITYLEDTPEDELEVEVPKWILQEWILEADRLESDGFSESLNGVHGSGQESDETVDKCVLDAALEEIRRMEDRMYKIEQSHLLERNVSNQLIAKLCNLKIE